jgi:hypothetical protein
MWGKIHPMEGIAAALTVGGLILFGVNSVKEVPNLQKKVEQHEIMLAVMRTDLSYIKQGMETLLRERSESGRDRGE